LRGWCSQGREGSNPSMVTIILILHRFTQVLVNI
jgi:hypothetical protein